MISPKFLVMNVLCFTFRLIVFETILKDIYSFFLPYPLSFMACYSPIRILDPSTKGLSPSERKYNFVPCGTCLGCRARKRQDIYFRAVKMFESVEKQGGFTIMATLTFDDKHLITKFGHACGDKKQLQAYLHRCQNLIRKKYGFTVKFIAVVEFGGLTGRPHYHVLFFIIPFDEYNPHVYASVVRYVGKFLEIEKILRNCWSRAVGTYNSDGSPIFESLGRTDFKLANYGGVNYVCKYIAKDIGEDDVWFDWKERFRKRYLRLGYKLFDDAVLRQQFFDKYHACMLRFLRRYGHFYLCSQGVGSSYEHEDLRRKIIYQEGTYINGYHYAIPRYYSDRIIRKELKDYECELRSELDINSLSRQKREYIDLWSDKLYREKFNNLPNYIRDSLERYQGTRILKSDIDDACHYVERLKQERRKKEEEKKEQENINLKRTLVQKGGYRLLNQFKNQKSKFN